MYSTLDSIFVRALRLSLVVVALLSIVAPTLASPAQGAMVGSVDSSKSQNKRPSKKELELSSSLQGLTGSPFNNDMVDGSGFIDKMIASADSYKNYSFDYSMKVFKDKKTIVEEGVFYFKQKPRMIRLEETGSFKKGSVAILGANGKVKAHMGGSMKMFVVELDPNSNMLRSANGFPMTDSDFSSLSAALKTYLKQGVTSQVTREAFDLKSENDRVFILELRKTKDPSKLWKRVAVSARTHLPVQWWDYDDDGNLWSHANWNDFKPNQQLADSLFNIKNDDDSSG